MTGLRAKAAELKKKQKSLIILWMGGGPTTIDLWDMKPDSPNGGEHKPKPTAASGVQITEHLPKVAEQFKNLSIIRSLSSGEGDHARGTYRMNTGNKPSPILEYPSIGSVLGYFQAMDVEAAKNADIPAFISLGNTVGTNPLTQNSVGGGFPRHEVFAVPGAEPRHAAGERHPAEGREGSSDAPSRRHLREARRRTGAVRQRQEGRDGRRPGAQGSVREGPEPRRLQPQGSVQPR